MQVTKQYLITDVESFPNLFQVGLKNFETDEYHNFFISNDEVFSTDRYNELWELISENTIVTYNGLGYDNHILAYLMDKPKSTANDLNQITKLLIEGTKNSPNDSKNLATYINETYSILTNTQCIKISRVIQHNVIKAHQLFKILDIHGYGYESVDLFKIVPNPQSLKMYGANLGLNIQELPYPTNHILNDEEIKNVIDYNMNDLIITNEVFKKLRKDIDLRQELNLQYDINCKSAYNDFRNKGNANLGLSMLETEFKINNKKISKSYRFKFEVYDYISFKSPQLANIVDKLRTHTFALNDNLSVKIPPFLKEKILLANNIFQIGIGGLHSNEKSLSVVAKENETIRNIDVTSYYPSMIFSNEIAPFFINNKLYANTLVKTFNERVEAKTIDKQLTKLSRTRPLSNDELKQLAHSKLINARNKIMLNGGGFGKLGDKYSKTFDPKAMLQITLLGQLQLLMLIEELDSIDGVTILSSNTDGIELLDSENMLNEIQNKVLSWEIMTKLNMEYGEYKALYARDVNNYVAVYNGYTKAKGAYAEPTFGKSFTHTIVYKAIREFLLNGTSLKSTIYGCSDINKFYSTAKVTGGALALDDNQLENIEYNELITCYDKKNKPIYKVIPKSKREKIDDVDIKELYDNDEIEHNEENYFKVYDINNPKTEKQIINKSQIKNVELYNKIGSTIRYYYTTNNVSSIIRYKSGNKVPNANGVILDLNPTDRDLIKHPIDYQRYIDIAEKELYNLGYTEK